MLRHIPLLSNSFPIFSTTFPSQFYVPFPPLPLPLPSSSVSLSLYLVSVRVCLRLSLCVCLSLSLLVSVCMSVCLSLPLFSFSPLTHWVHLVLPCMRTGSLLGPAALKSTNSPSPAAIPCCRLLSSRDFLSPRRWGIGWLDHVLAISAAVKCATVLQCWTNAAWLWHLLLAFINSFWTLTSEVIHENQGKRCDPDGSSRPEHCYCVHIDWFPLYFWAGFLTWSLLVRLHWLASKLQASAIHTCPRTTSVSNCVWLLTWMLRIQACLASTF